MGDQLRKQLCDVLAAVAELPIEERVSLIGEFSQSIRDLGRLVPDLPEPDLSGSSYPLYVKRTNAIEHLERCWGTWLTRFNPTLDYDRLDQKRLRERDPVLATAIANQLRHEPEKMSDFVPPYKGKTSSNDASLDP